MAVQIPTLDRTQPPELASVGRIDERPPDLQGPIEHATGAVVSATEALAEKQKVQKMWASHTDAQTTANDLHIKFDKMFNGNPGRAAGTNGADDPGEQPTLGVKQMQGDPTPVYQQFYSNIQNSLADVKSASASKDPYTQYLTMNSANQVAAKFMNQATTAQGRQYLKYTENSANAAADIAQNDAVDSITTSAAAVGVDNPDDTFKEGDAKMAQVANIIYQKAAKLEQATPVAANPNDKDASGVPKITGYKNVSPQITSEVQKRQSTVAKNAVEAAILPDQDGNIDIDNAKAIYERYGKYLDPVGKRKVQQQLAKATDQQSGEDLFNDNKGLDYPKMVENIQSAKDVTDAARDHAMQKAVTYKTQMTSMNDAREKQGLTMAGQMIFQKMQNGTPYNTPEEMLTDPPMAKIIQVANLTPEHINALSSLVKPPKESDPDALQNAQDKMKDPNWMKNASVADQIQVSKGLAPKDATNFRNHVAAYQQVTPPELDKQKTSMMKYAEQTLLSLGVSGDHDIGIKEVNQKKGQYSSKDQIKLNNFTSSILADSDNFNKMSTSEQQQYVNDKVIKMIQDKPKDTSWFGNTNDARQQFIKTHSAPVGVPSTVPGSASPSTQNVPGTPANVTQAKLDAVKKFVQQYGKRPDWNNPNDTKNFNTILNGK
jgi:hypothetical protein